MAVQCVHAHGSTVCTFTGSTVCTCTWQYSVYIHMTVQYVHSQAVQCVHAHGSTVCTFTWQYSMYSTFTWQYSMYIHMAVQYVHSQALQCVHAHGSTVCTCMSLNYNVYFLFDMVAVLPEGDEVRARG